MNATVKPESMIKLNKSIKSGAKAIRINKEAKMDTKPKGNPVGEYKCSCCGKVYRTQKNHFPVSFSPLFEGNNGYLTICKECVDKYYINLVDFYSGNEEHAMEHCCQLFDWYYSPVAMSMTKTSNNGFSRVSMYPSKMSIIQVRSKGTTYLDTIRQKTDEKILSADDIKNYESEEATNDEKYVASKETVMFFGLGYTNEEYEFLQRQYDDWTDRNECKTKAQEELYKNICIAQLTIQRAQHNGSTKEITDAMKAFQDLLGTTNIKPSQADGVYNDNQSFGAWIRKFENEKPISNEKMNEFKDVDGIQKYIDTFFTGHLCKALDIKNPKDTEYQKEIDKYTIKVNDETEENNNASAIFDKTNNEEGQL